MHDLGTTGEPSGEIEDLRVLPDGRILAAGAADAGMNDDQPFVARFTPTGDLDPTFANGGVFRANPTPGDDEAIRPGGPARRQDPHRRRARRIRACTSGDTGCCRLTPEGQLDPTFGNGGEAFASAVPGDDAAFGLALQPDGRAVIAGDAEDADGVEAPGRQVHRRPAARAITRPRQPRCAGRKATLVGTGKPTGSPARNGPT